MNKTEIRRFMKFALVGVVNTGTSFVVYVLLMGFGIQYLVASSLAYVVGIGISYILNSKHVFKAQKSYKNFAKFASVYLTALGVNLVLLFLMVDVFGMNRILGQLMVTGLVLFYNYGLQRLWTFKKD